VLRISLREIVGPFVRALAGARTQLRSVRRGESMPRVPESWWTEPADVASQQMLRLQIDNLAMRFRTIGRPNASDNLQKIYDRLAGVFETPAKPDVVPPVAPPRELTWDDAYRIESEIASLLSGARLRQELTSRLRWAVFDHVPEATDLQARYTELVKAFPETAKSPDSPDPADDVFRDFQLDILEAIHWHSRRKHIARKLRSQATRRTLFFGLLALMAVLIPWFLASAAAPIKTAQVASLRVEDLLPIGFFTQENGGKQFALYTALMFGFMGAIFSRLITLQRQWEVMALDELYNARTRSYIFLRATIGTLGALVIYFFLQSGLVSGSVFPNFDDLGMSLKTPNSSQGPKWPSQLLLPSGGLSLLIMWSFIAGFSETLVSTVLNTTQQQFGGAVGTAR
jgi:hypothetical protein